MHAARSKLHSNEQVLIRVSLLALSLLVQLVYVSRAQAQFCQPCDIEVPLLLEGDVTCLDENDPDPEGACRTDREIFVRNCPSGGPPEECRLTCGRGGLEICANISAEAMCMDAALCGTGFTCVLPLLTGAGAVATNFSFQALELAQISASITVTGTRSFGTTTLGFGANGLGSRACAVFNITDAAPGVLTASIRPSPAASRQGGHGAAAALNGPLILVAGGGGCGGIGLSIAAGGGGGNAGLVAVSGGVANGATGGDGVSFIGALPGEGGFGGTSSGGAGGAAGTSGGMGAAGDDPENGGTGGLGGLPNADAGSGGSGYAGGGGGGSGALSAGGGGGASSFASTTVPRLADFASASSSGTTPSVSISIHYDCV